MDAKQNIYDFQMKRFKVFKAQDPANGKFDVIFEIDGKKLYAHKYLLCSISSKFESMLSEVWIKSNGPIAITDYSFDDFKELLTFLYSGQCQLTTENIMNMLDIAKSYGVNEFKETCEKFLISIEPNLENACQIMELSIKYSIENVKKSVNEFISNNLSLFLKSKEFQNLQKSAVIEIVQLNQRTSKREELCEAVYKWGENQVLKKNNNRSNMHDKIREELSEILPYIRFEKMGNEFFATFVVRKSLLSSYQLCNVLLMRQKIYVIIIDENGREMEGELQCDEKEKVAAVIQLVGEIST